MAPGSTPAPSTKEDKGKATSKSSISRHKTYYFEDGNIILLAETTLFKLHKSLLLFSPFFQDLLSLHQPTGDAVQGTSDSNPIDISAKDVPSSLNIPVLTASDFSDFLSVFLPMTGVGVNRSAESWGRVLKTASMLQFDSIRALAITNLGPSADPIIKIDLGVRHNHRQFVIDGIKEMSLAPAPLPVDAALTLDAISFYHLSSAREKIRTHLTHKVTTPFAWTCTHGGQYNGYNNYNQPCAGSSQVVNELKTLIAQPLPAKAPAGVDYKRAVHALAKESLSTKYQLCDYCQTVWDTSIAKHLELDKVDKIITDQIDSSAGRADGKKGKR